MGCCRSRLGLPSQRTPRASPGLQGTGSRHPSLRGFRRRHSAYSSMRWQWRSGERQPRGRSFASRPHPHLHRTYSPLPALRTASCEDLLPRRVRPTPSPPSPAFSAPMRLANIAAHWTCQPSPPPASFSGMHASSAEPSTSRAIHTHLHLLPLPLEACHGRRLHRHHKVVSRFSPRAVGRT